MDAASRRQAILDRLRTADRPVSASALAAGLNVSRQIIVGDIALLRAGGAYARLWDAQQALENYAKEGAAL